MTLDVNLLSEFFAWSKAHSLAFFDGDGLTGTWITATSWSLVTNRKRSEVDQLNGFTIKKGLFHGVEKGVDDVCTTGLRVT